MKRIAFSRKSILRAIHAACVALYLLAAQREASAQSYTPPFQVSGSTVTTSSGTFGTGSGLYEPATTYSSLTIGAGTTINSTIPYAGSGSAYTTPSSLITTAASTFSNAGTLTLSGTYGAGSGTYQAVVDLNQGATSVTATNTGSISGTLTGGGQQASRDEVLQVLSTTGDISINNSGSLLLPSGTYFGDAINVVTTSGDVAITNTQSGTVSNATSGAGNGIVVANSTGTTTVLNAGAVGGSGSLRGVDVEGNGIIQVTNTDTGSITGTYQGINVYGATVSVNNSGAISGASYSGIYAGGNSVSVTNNASGTISNSGAAIYVAQYAGTGPLSVTNNGTLTASTGGIYVAYADPGSTVTLTNGGSITTTNSGIYSAVIANVINSGSITAPTAISVPSGSTVTLSGRPAISGTIIGGSTSASTSQLIFNLAIPSANLAAAQAQLNTELAAYAAQSGGNYTFTVDGLTYDVSNFAYNQITDDLTLPPVTRHYADTPGYNSMGTVLDNLNTGNAQASTILNALNNVPDADVAAALSELSPQQLQVFRNVAFDNNTFNVAKINNHLANRRDGATGFDTSQLTVQDPTMDGTLDQVRSHLLAYNNPASSLGPVSDSTQAMFGAVDAKDDKGAKTTELATAPSDPWSTFIAGDVLLANLSNSATQQNSNYTTGSVTAGFDYQLDDHFTVGALFSYSHTDANLDSRGSSATVDSYTPGIYASYVNKGWYANFLGAYSRNAYTSDRIVDIPGLAGDNHGGTHGNQGSANFTGGYEFQKGAFKFGPIASLQYVHLEVDAMHEQGPTALSINSQDQDSLRSQLGFEGRFVANVNTPIGPMTLTPHLSASWQHEYMDSSGGITSQFTGTGGGSFLTQTQPPDRDAAFIDVGLDANIGPNITLFADYETQAGQQNYFAQSAQGGVKVGF